MGGLLAASIGMLLAVVGVDQLSGAGRLTFGIEALDGGVGFIPVLIGIFALSEAFWRVINPERSDDATFKTGVKVAPWSEWWMRKATLVKSVIIGTVIGILPGVGATTASFVSYGEASRSGRFKEKFGTGEPEGVIASEAANNAVTGGAMIPTIALGIPGDPVTAIILAALVIQGIQPGPKIFIEHGDVIRQIFVALVICNVAMLVAGLYVSKFASYLLVLPKQVLTWLIIVLSFVGAYVVTGTLFGVVVTIIAGGVGYLLRLVKIPLAPIVIGMVLEPILEISLRQGLVMVGGDWWLFADWHDPISLGFWILTILVVITSLRRQFRKVK